MPYVIFFFFLNFYDIFLTDKSVFDKKISSHLFFNLNDGCGSSYYVIKKYAFRAHLFLNIFNEEFVVEKIPSDARKNRYLSMVLE